MNAFLFFRCEIRMLYFFFLFSQRVQILKTEYKYGQYGAPLSQSDCRYFLCVSDKSIHQGSGLSLTIFVIVMEDPLLENQNGSP